MTANEQAAGDAANRLTKKIAEARRLDAEATPRPWEWNEGWNDNLPKHSDDYSADKYSSLELMSASYAVIPIRVDHHEYIVDFDPRKREAISSADRDIIAHARNHHAALWDLVEAAKWESDEAGSAAMPKLRAALVRLEQVQP